jgi:hypothetical protein
MKKPLILFPVNNVIKLYCFKIENGILLPNSIEIIIFKIAQNIRVQMKLLIIAVNCIIILKSIKIVTSTGMFFKLEPIQEKETSSKPKDV